MPLIHGLRCLLFIAIVCAPALAGTLDEVLERGTVRVGVAEFAPWTLRDSEGELIGFEVDLARKLAADMGVEAEFRVYVWDEIIAALRSGDIDVIAGGMAITPARALQVNFSRPVAVSGVGLVTHTARTRDVDSLGALDSEGRVVVSVGDTFAASVADSLFRNARLTLFADAAAAEAELLAGSADAYVTSLPEARFLVLRHGETVDLPVDDPLVAQSEAMAVRKGEQEWLNFLDAWVTARRSDKWIETTRDYWFATLDWAENRED